MSDAAHRFRKAAIERTVRGAGSTPADQRQAAFDNRNVPAAAAALVDTIARNAWKVTDEDVAAAKAAGLSEDAIFELAVSAAMGQATRQLDSALAAVDAAFAPAAKESA